MSNKHFKLKFAIPPRPEVLLQLSAIVEQQEPDIDLVISIIREDPGLYSMVLSTVNAPCFGLRRTITSLSHSVMLLGLPRLFKLVKLALIKNTLRNNIPMERFWDTASEVALIIHDLTQKYTDLDADVAYSIGMLHDSGIPLIMQVDKGYKDILRMANGHSQTKLTKIEQERYGINHFSLGARLVKEWKMPPDIYNTIELQASFPDVIKINKEKADDCLMYLALLSIAKDISQSYRHYWRLEKTELIPKAILVSIEYIGLCDYDYMDLKEEFLAKLNNTS